MYTGQKYEVCEEGTSTAMMEEEGGLTAQWKISLCGRAVRLNSVVHLQVHIS
jgi:hypothetical protein